jgi:hypothetical protein
MTTPFYTRRIYLVMQIMTILMSFALITGFLRVFGALHKSTGAVLTCALVGAVAYITKKHSRPILVLSEKTLTAACKRLSIAGTLERTAMLVFLWEDIASAFTAERLKGDWHGIIWEVRSFWGRPNLFIVPRETKEVFYVRDFFKIADKDNLVSLLRQKITVTEIHSLGEIMGHKSCRGSIC